MCVIQYTSRSLPSSCGADGRLAPHRLRRAVVAPLPRLRRGLRRTHARAGVWERVRGVPRRRPALDTADDPMAVGMIDLDAGPVTITLRKGDTFVAWKLERIGRDLRHRVNLVHDLTNRGVGLRVLAGEGAAIDTTTSNGRLMFGFFAALAEVGRELIVERTKAGLASARARGRNGGREFKILPPSYVSPRPTWVSQAPRSVNCASSSASVGRRCIAT